MEQDVATQLHWAINDAHELERANPKPRCVDAVSAMSQPWSTSLRLPKPHPCWSDATHDDVGAVHSWAGGPTAG
jgi:hypothetical protein